MHRIDCYIKKNMETLAALLLLIYFLSPVQGQTTGARDLTSKSSITLKSITTSLPITKGQTTQGIQHTPQTITTGNKNIVKITQSSPYQSTAVPTNNAKQTMNDNNMSTGLETTTESQSTGNQTESVKRETQTLEITTTGSLIQVAETNLSTQSKAMTTSSTLTQPIEQGVSTPNVITKERISITEAIVTKGSNVSSESVNSTETMSPGIDTTNIPEKNTSDSNFTFETSFVNISTLSSTLHNASNTAQSFITTESASLMYNLSSSDATTVSSVNVTMESNNITMTNLSANLSTGNVSMTEITVTYMSTLFPGVENVTENSTFAENSTENYTDAENVSTVNTSVNSTEATLFPFDLSPARESVFLFIFKGNCSLLVANETLVQDFVSELDKFLNNKLNLTNIQLVLGNITCDGNLHINITVFNISETILDQMHQLKLEGNISVVLLNETLIFLLHDIVWSTSVMDDTTSVISTVTMMPTSTTVTDSVFKFTFTGDCLLLVPDWYENTEVSTEASNIFNKTLMDSASENITASVGTLSNRQSEPLTTTNMNDHVTELNDNTTDENTTAVSYLETTEPLIMESTTEGIIYYEQFANLSLVDQFKNIFQILVLEALSFLNVSIYDISTSNISCGSVIINLTVYNTTDRPEVDSFLTDLLKNRNFVIYVRDINGMYHKYALNEVVLISSPRMPKSTTVADTTMYKPIDIEEGLNELEIIVIIVFGVIGSTILIFFISFVIYRCCTTRNSKSFTLADTPNNQVILEDFTLTKMNRPMPIYTDQGVVLTPPSTMNNRNTAAKHSTTTPYTNPVYQAGTNGHYDNYRASASGLNHPATRSSTENLVPSGKVHTNPGIENPSFSSDDVLDSGSNTSTDLPYDGRNDSSVR